MLVFLYIICSCLLFDKVKKIIIHYQFQSHFLEDITLAYNSESKLIEHFQTSTIVHFYLGHVLHNLQLFSTIPN